MKQKLLNNLASRGILIASAMLLATSAVYAAPDTEITLTPKSGAYKTMTSNGVTVNTPNGTWSSPQLRVDANDEMTISTTSDTQAISKVVLGCSSAQYTPDNITITPTATISKSSTNTTVTFADPTKTTTFKFTGKARIKTVTVTLTDYASNKVANPVFNPISGTSFEGNGTVTISCPTEGAIIKYTINGGAEQNYTSDGISLNAIDTYTIVAHAELDGLENSDNVTATYAVSKVLQDSGIKFASASYDAYIGTPFESPELINPNNLAVSYTSSDNSIATVNADGIVTLGSKRGETTITATFDGNEDFRAGETSYILNVTDPNVKDIEFALVTDASQIVDGGEYIIVNEPFKVGQVQYGTYVMGDIKSNNKGFNAISIDANATSVSETLVLSSDLGYTTVVLESATNGYNLKVGNQYLNGETKSTLCLKDEVSSATVTFNDDKTVSILTGKDGTKDITIQMYGQNVSGKPGNESFNAYSSNQHPIYFYTPVPATPELDGVEMTGGKITGNQLAFKQVEGASVWYKIETETVNNGQMREVNAEGYTKYESAPVTLNKNMKSVTFYAENDATKAKSAPVTIAIDLQSGIAGIEAEAGEAVYYNLQGVRVENPVKGLYIRVANGKSQKVIM